jgi:hypothetical protein
VLAIHVRPVFAAEMLILDTSPSASCRVVPSGFFPLPLLSPSPAIVLEIRRVVPFFGITAVRIVMFQKLLSILVVSMSIKVIILVLVLLFERWPDIANISNLDVRSDIAKIKLGHRHWTEKRRSLGRFKLLIEHLDEGVRE